MGKSLLLSLESDTWNENYTIQIKIFLFLVRIHPKHRKIQIRKWCLWESVYLFLMNKIIRSLIEIVNKIKRNLKMLSGKWERNIRILIKFCIFSFIQNVHQASGHLIHHQVICPKKYIQNYLFLFSVLFH